MKLTQKIWECVFIGGLIVLPFVYWLPARVAFEVPRGWMVMGWVEILFLVAAFGGMKRTVLDPRLMRWWWGVFGVMTVVSIVGVDVTQSWVGNYYRADGLWVYLHIWLLAMLVGWYGMGDLMRKSFLALAGGVGVLAGWGVVQKYFGLMALGTTPWVDGGLGLSFGNPNYLVGYVAVLLPVVWNVGEQLQQKWGTWARLVNVIPALVLMGTGSRAGWLVLGLFWVGLGLFLVSKKSIRSIMGLLLIVGMLFGLWQVLGDTKYTSKTLGYESRERIVRKMLDGWKQRPWLGYGWANADKAFEAGVWPYVVERDVYVDKAHAHVLEYLVTTGLVGMLGYVVMMGILIAQVAKQYRRSTGEKRSIYLTLLGGLVMYVLHSQMNVVGVAQEAVWAILVGFSWSKM